MRKTVIAALILAIMINIGLCGCGGKTSDNTNKTNSTAVEADISGTTVKVLWARDLVEDEKLMIETFEKKYNCKVEFSYAPSEEYNTKLTSLIVAKDSPDVCLITRGGIDGKNSGSFPTGVLQTMQPISVTGLDIDDKLWAKDIMDAYKINGEYYCFASYNNWYDAASVIYYNVDLFEENGITTPRELWESNNWNWKTFEDAALKISKLGKDYFGYIPRDNYNLLLSTGKDYVTYDGSKFTSVINEEHVLNSFKFNATLIAEGAESAPGGQSVSENFLSGKGGMMAHNTWCMRKDSILDGISFTVDAVPFPGPEGQKEVYSIMNPNLMGVAKNSKNPKGAGLFIKYMLNGENYPTAIEDAIVNPEMADVWNYVSSKDAKKVFLYSGGVVGYLNAKDLADFTYRLFITSPDNIKTVIDSYRSVIDNAVNTTNDKLAEFAE